MRSNYLKILLPLCLGLALTSLAASAQAHRGAAELVKFEWNNKVGNVRIDPYYFMQDSRGRMWIATNSGPVSFDGYNFKLYGAEEFDLSTSRTIRLAEDMHGNIWIVGFRNSKIVIDVMNPETEKVQSLHQYLGIEQPVEIPMREEVVQFFCIRGKIWLGTLDGAYLYDGRWQQVYTSSDQNRRDYWLPAADGSFWKAGRNKQYYYLENSRGVITDSMPWSRYLWLDNQLNLWTSTEYNSTRCSMATAVSGKIFIRESGSMPDFEWISEVCTPVIQLNSPRQHGYLWETAGDDLLLGLENSTEMINLSRQFPGISASGMFYFDREGGIWTATRNSIIRLSVNRNTRFQTIMSDPTQDRSIRGMIQQGNWLYINSYKEDFRVNLNDYSDVEKIEILNEQGLTFLPDKSGFWVGGHLGKIARFRTGEPREMYNFTYRPDILSFLQCPGSILVGTSNGLLRINEKNRSVTQGPLQNLGVDYMYRNDRGIWVCTTNGLYLLDEQGNVKGHFLQPDQRLNYKKLTFLYEDRNGDFWIATWGAGLIRWSEEQGIKGQFTTSEGLSSNDLHAVYEDARSYLWIPGNYGLVRIQKKTGNIQAFFKRDGVADDEFNAMSHFRSPDGKLFFGGTNGITVFHPDSFPSGNPLTHALQLMEARTFRVKGASFINQLPGLDSGDPLVLTPDDDYLDIRVSPCIYEDVNQIRYSWKIEGYSEDWVQQPSPVIRIHNLPYGKYVLRVRYSTQGNIWSENELSVPLLIVRPFYLSWYFLVSAALLILGGAWGFSNWRTRQLMLANTRLEEEVANRTRQIEHDKQVIEIQARELRSLDELKSRFFTNITHELRTPLTLILGPVEQIVKASDISTKVRDSATMVKRNAIKLLNLVEELLDLSRIEANKLALLEKPVALYPFVTRIVSIFAPYYEHRGIDLKLKYDCPADLTLMMDAQKWEKIINNLLNNAIKFTPTGGMVLMEFTISGQELLVSVADTGSGIHPEDLPYIFDRYYQAHSSGQPLQGGAGIGLSLCREYMRLFGGEISVQSTQGKGSLFTLRCPIKPAILTEPVPAVPEIAFPVLPEQNPSPAGKLQEKPVLLLVEDDRDMSAYIQTLLIDDYRIMTAENGIQALKMLEKQPADLVLSDIMMPGMDGFQLLKVVKERYRDVPFIMLTARADAPDRLSALTLGVDDYLTKPFLDEELKVRLTNLIARYHTRKSAQIQAEPGNQEESFDQKWLKQLEAEVLENIGNPDYSLDELAEQLNMSRRNLYNKVLACTGMTPNQYLTEVRLHKARQLIESKTFSTMAEVCYAVGMKTPYYFSKLMKERYG